MRCNAKQTTYSPVEEDMHSQMFTRSIDDRQHFIGGSDARIIMGGDETALIRLWQEKRGESKPADLSGELVVQLGLVTEDLNRSWYERQSGHRVGQRQARKFHSSIVWMAA